MKQPKDNQEYIRPGYGGSRYSDLLIGNRAGLEKLRSNITEALEKGESLNCVGDFSGIKCLDNEFFENKTDHPKDHILGILIVLPLWIIFIAGIMALFKCLSN